MNRVVVFFFTVFFMLNVAYGIRGDEITGSLNIHQVADPYEQGTFRGVLERIKGPGNPQGALCEG